MRRLQRNQARNDEYRSNNIRIDIGELVIENRQRSRLHSPNHNSDGSGSGDQISSNDRQSTWSSAGDSSGSVSSNGNQDSVDDFQPEDSSTTSTDEDLTDEEDLQTDPILTALAELRQRIAVQQRRLDVYEINQEELLSICTGIDQISIIVRNEVGHRHEQRRLSRLNIISSEITRLRNSIGIARLHSPLARPTES